MENWRWLQQGKPPKTLSWRPEQACSTRVSFRFFAEQCDQRERQRGCGKIGLSLRRLFPPLDATCPTRAWWAQRSHVTPGRGGRVKTNQTKSLHVTRRVEIMRRDFVVQISIFSMPRCFDDERQMINLASHAGCALAYDKD